MGGFAKQNIKKQWVAFLPGMQKLFIENILKESKLTIYELAFLVGVHPRSFRDWRREVTRMNLKAFEILSEKFNITTKENKEILVQRWKNLQRKANQIGGNVTFKKYGSFLTQEGRIKGGLKSIAILRERGFVTTKHFQKPTYSSELAEFVGIMLGDGGMTPSQCAITLNGKADAKYILFVCKLANMLFGEMPKTFKHKHDKAVTIYYSGIELIAFLKGLGLSVGDKVKQQVDTPEWVKSNKEYSTACLRGLMDTDGGIFLHKYKYHGKEYVYKNICFTNKSMPLITFVFEILCLLGFTPKLRDTIEIKKVWLYNEHEVNRYLELVGTSNYRLGKYGEVA